MTTIASRYQFVQKNVQHVLQEAGRADDHVDIIAVSKTHSIAEIEEAMKAGIQNFGENKVQEALPKIAALSQSSIVWHFIGTVQSNKTRHIAEQFSWVHSLDNVHLAERLNEQRPAHLSPLNVCLQINIDSDPNKRGVLLTEVESVATYLQRLPLLRFRGLMTVLEHHRDSEKTRSSYQKMSRVYNELLEQGYELDTLSMGMSNDYELAISAGATMVRIGTAIFGAREFGMSIACNIG